MAVKRRPSFWPFDPYPLPALMPYLTASVTSESGLRQRLRFLTWRCAYRAREIQMPWRRRTRTCSFGLEAVIEIYDAVTKAVLVQQFKFGMDAGGQDPLAPAH